LLGRFREAFDYVIIDTPPALETADARVLARSSDGVIAVLRANRSRTPEALETASQSSAIAFR
jgi:Mrp family chromosome partitioning ATPase